MAGYGELGGGHVVNVTGNGYIGGGGTVARWAGIIQHAVYTATTTATGGVHVCR